MDFFHWIPPNESFHRCVNGFSPNLVSLSREANAQNRNFLISPIMKNLFFFLSNTGFDESKQDREMNRPFVH